MGVLMSMKTTSNKYFVPLVWAGSVVTRARKEGRIKDDFAVKTLIDVSTVRTL
jgi:bestrophin, other